MQPVGLNGQSMSSEFNIKTGLAKAFSENPVSRPRKTNVFKHMESCYAPRSA